MNICTVVLKEDSNVWHRQLLDTLRAMGHKLFSPKIGLNDTWYRLLEGRWSFRQRREISSRLLEQVRRIKKTEGVDLFFTYFAPFQFDAPVFKEIGSLGIPTVLFYCDNLQYPEIAERFSQYFTLTWVPELKAVELYRKLKRNFFYLPMAANPDFNEPIEMQQEKEVVFIGTKNPYRRWLLGTAIAKGLPVEIYGSHWHPNSAHYKLDSDSGKGTYEPLSWAEKTSNFLEEKQRTVQALFRYGLRPRLLREKVQRRGEEYEELVRHHACPDPINHQRVRELYAQGKVILGENHYIDPGYTDLDNLTYSKARDLEAPMSGACYLTRYTEELDHFYPEKGIIMVYHSVDELCDKAALLLKDKGLRDKMGQKARRFCLEHHTWQHRFKKLFDKLGLS